MPTPFPGMDPYLEHPRLWPDVHNALIAAIRADLTPRLRPRYVARLRERTVPIEQVRETWIEVHPVRADEKVITVVEVLSPWNKRSGSDAHAAYERKRRTIVSSLTHLVEIDLCRSGAPMPMVGDYPASDYRVLVSRSEDRPRAALYPFGVRDPLPAFTLPLREGDEEPPVDLQRALARVWDEGAFDLRVAYRTTAVPPLAAADAAWAREITQRRATA